jgi:surface polysaccharide O-acyltransferase-like enzyme
MARFDSLDIFRLIASFAVVILHVSMGVMPLDIQIYIKLLARFAVPFFFLVSGYFFYIGYKKAGNEFFLKNIIKLLGIFLVASLFFLPINILKGDFRFSQRLILTGTESHLWFLPSLIFGMICCWYIMNTVKSFKFLPIISILTAIPFLLYYYSVGTNIQKFIDLEFARFLLSVSFLSFGLYLAHYEIKLSLKKGLTLLLIGLILMVLEVNYFRVVDPVDLWGFQFLLNTIPLSIGVFIVSFHSFNNSYIANLGRRYSLGIYLYHPFINMIIYRIILKLAGSHSDIVLIVNPIICFLATLGLLILLDKKTPSVFKVLNGEFKKN